MTWTRSVCLLSSNGPTRAGQAACILLHTMWNHNELHSVYKKVGSFAFVIIYGAKVEPNPTRAGVKLITFFILSVVTGNLISSTQEQQRLWTLGETELWQPRLALFSCQQTVVTQFEKKYRKSIATIACLHFHVTWNVSDCVVLIFVWGCLRRKKEWEA